MTRERLKQLLRIEKIMESEACLSCGGAPGNSACELTVYEVSDIVKNGRYDRAVIAAEFSVERGDDPAEVAGKAAEALKQMEEEYKNGNITEVEYARCVEAADKIIKVAGPGFEDLLEEFLQ